MNFLSVLMTNKIIRNHFYVHSISVRYADRRTSKNERNKIVSVIHRHLTSGCIKTRDDIRKLLILEETSLNLAHCHKFSKRWLIYEVTAYD